MINLTIAFFLLILLINSNILLLNEETLILLCFIIFCWLGITKLQNLIFTYFHTQQNLIKSTYVDSFQIFKNSIQLTILKNNTIKIWTKQFFNLKIHSYTFSKNILNFLPKIYQNKFQFSIVKKLIFTKRLEQQMLKLISLILIEKVIKIIKLQKFLSLSLKFKPMFTINKIYLHEYLKKIN